MPRTTDPPEPPARRQRGFEAAGRILQPRIAAAGKGRGAGIERLIAQWREIAGEDLGAITTPLRIARSREAGAGAEGATLTLAVRAALAPVVQMRLPALIARINAAFGHRAVARIRIVQDGPAAAAFAEAPRPFDPALAAPPPEGGPAEGIADAGLRDALATLGRNIITRALKEGSRR
ncbi:MAG: hypothetical protein RLZ26_1121 [Pseudomonadota bacterium]